jgi:hypothetical protein
VGGLLAAQNVAPLAPPFGVSERALPRRGGCFW